MSAPKITVRTENGKTHISQGDKTIVVAEAEFGAAVAAATGAASESDKWADQVRACLAMQTTDRETFECAVCEKQCEKSDYGGKALALGHVVSICAKCHKTPTRSVSTTGAPYTLQE